MTTIARDSTLNLARKWRPRTFDEVVGQPLPIKMLKNTLFLGNFFPVYIFSGERGCGKTTTARIFAAALNCTNLADFRKDPKSSSVPCLSCDSCTMILAGNHPDFIEIDAASHTGVDNVRNLIESAAHLPLVGSYKIYLIDEAHMLSKAAFNAFLKMLEEPPPNVCFMLATTELEKIPDTVRSRTFQLFFTAVSREVLAKYIKDLASKEQVSLSDEVCQLIVQEARGSLRDAANIFERVRYLGDNCSAQTVRKALGHLHPGIICEIFEKIIQKDSAGVLALCDSHTLASYDPQMVWQVCLSLIQSLIRLFYGVSTIDEQFLSHHESIIKLKQESSLVQLRDILGLLWSQEQVFLRTAHKHAFLEHIFLSAAAGDLRPSTALPSGPAGSDSVVLSQQSSKAAVDSQARALSPAKGADPSWEQLVCAIKEQGDPLLMSIFGQAQYTGFDSSSKIIRVTLRQKSSFFAQKIQDSRPLLEKIIGSIFSPGAWFEFTYEAHKKVVSRPKEPIAPRAEKPAPMSATSIDVSDETAWPKANLIKKYFPGRIEKDVQKEEHKDEKFSS